MKRNGRPIISAAALYSVWISSLVVSVIGIPLQSNDSAENTRVITELLSSVPADQTALDLNETRQPVGLNLPLIQKTSDPSPADDLNQTSVSGPFYRLTEQQWQQLTEQDGPLITEVAFNVGSRSSPRYAFITADSYKRYLEYLKDLCRKSQDDDIAETKLSTLDNDYFRWEELQFNRALIKQIFPETANGDHSRYLNASQTLRQMHLRAEPPSECQTSDSEDTWSDRANERSQFEDFIINTVLDYEKTVKMKGSRYRKTGNKKIGKGNSTTTRDEVVGINSTFTTNTTDLLDEILGLEKQRRPPR